MSEMPQFVAIINAIEAEIKYEHIGGAIKWADDHFDGAWSNAIDRFDKALAVAIQRQDWTLAKIEGDFYKQNVLNLLQKYKAAKNLDETEGFLKALGVR